MIQQNLFNETIRSISYNNDDILENIIELHCPGGFEVDPTYSIGNFYKGNIKKPRYKFDLFPRGPGVVKASADNLPMVPESVNSIMFDPPFVVGGDHNSDANMAKENNCIIGKRFSSFKSWDELRDFYTGAITEMYRVLKFKGILVFKCQDVVANGKNHFSHVYIMNEAQRVGFYPKDLFVLLAKCRIIGGAIKKQQHARKFHSYFWVFEKTIRAPKLNYDSFNGNTPEVEKA